MRTVLVKSQCDICGSIEITNAEFNDFHDAYEDTLPVGWIQIDEQEYPLINFNGDQCQKCYQSLRQFMPIAFQRWKNHISAFRHKICGDRP